MGITPSGDTRASTGKSDEVIGIIPSSSICSEYDSATANSKPNCLIMLVFVGFVQTKLRILERTKCIPSKGCFQFRVFARSW